jgi:hypothetical protein
MTLSTWELRDPEQLITAVADLVPLDHDTAYAVLVRAPSTDQELLDVRRIELPALLDDSDDISEDLCDLAGSFHLPDVRIPQHALVTVIVRSGRCLVGPNEGVWLAGWRYSNHFAPVFDSDLFVVTEHGWVHFFSDCAGHEPHSRSAELRGD